MTKKSSDTPIYSQDYYRFQKLIRNPKFQERVRWLYSRYERAKCPVPRKGFKTNKEYEDWLSKFWDVYTQAEHTHGMQQETATYSEKEVDGKIKFHIKVNLDTQDHRFPPVPGQFVREVLNEFGFDDKNKRYREFLSAYLFRGKKEYREQVLRVRGIRNQKTGQPEWFIQIFPHTKKDHVTENWDFIAKTLERLPGYVGKNKPWENFERDLYIHRIYKDLQSRLELKRTSFKKGQKPLDEQTWLIVKKKYPGIRMEQIKPTVSKVDALDKGIA